jgi:AcrR family transcriptional regulator
MNHASARLPRRRDEARALFRNAILDAAEAVFAERGFHGARIQDIAEKARIAVGTVYNHFAQKDDVLSALLEERTEAMLAALSASGATAPSFGELLRVRVARMLAYVEEHRAFFAIATEHGLFAGSATPGAPPATKRLRHVERFRAVFRAFVQEGIASGDLEPLGADALARFLGGTIRAFLLSSLVEENADVQAHAATIVDLFLHGAARRRPRRSPRVLTGERDGRSPR